MAAKGPARNQDDEPRDEVSLGAAITIPTEPYSDQSSTPPDYAHSRVLPIVLDPCGTPPMLGEGINDAPSRNDSTIEEFLGPAGALEP